LRETERERGCERDGESLSEAVVETEIDQCLDHLSLISQRREIERERERMGEVAQRGCCPPMDLFRSEPMQLVQLIIPIESAHRTVSYLGDLGLLQFKDVSTFSFSDKPFLTSIVFRFFVANSKLGFRLLLFGFSISSHNSPAYWSETRLLFCFMFFEECKFTVVLNWPISEWWLNLIWWFSRNWLVNWT